MDKQNLHFQVETSILLNIITVKFMEIFYFNILMEINMKGFLKTTKKTVREYLFGVMETN